MAVEIFFMIKSPRMKVPDVGIESGPLACQTDMLPIELPHPVTTCKAGVIPTDVKSEI